MPGAGPTLVRTAEIAKATGPDRLRALRQPSGAGSHKGGISKSRATGTGQATPVQQTTPPQPAFRS
jgi:hypothetical protein